MSFDSILLEAMKKTKVISIHAAAQMCDTKLICVDPAHDERWCARCDAMLDASDQIQQKILSLLDSKHESNP